MKPSPKTLSIASGLRLLPGLAAACGIVALAILPKARSLGLDHPPAFHPHGPHLSLLAHAAPQIQLHLAAVLIALIIGIVLLIGVKGSRVHRILGWTWAAAMMIGAVSSLFIRITNHGSFSLIHLLSGWTIVALPMGVAFARRHQVRLHARMMTGLFTGGLVLAGALTFLPGRLMWRLFFA